MEYKAAREALESLAASQKGRFLEERTDMEIPTSPEFIGEISGHTVSLRLDDAVEFRLWVRLKFEAPFKIRFADHILAAVEKISGIVVDMKIGDGMLDSKYVIDGLWVEERKDGMSVSPMAEETLIHILDGLGFKDAIMRMGLPDEIAVENRSLTIHTGIGKIADEHKLMEHIKEAFGLAEHVDAFMERARKDGLWKDGGQ